MINGLLRLPDDNIEIIRNANDFEDVVREKLGDDAGDMLRKIIDNAAEDVRILEDVVREHEMIIDGYLSALRDLRETAEDLRREIDKPRVNKSAVRALIDRTETEISNYI